MKKMKSVLKLYCLLITTIFLISCEKQVDYGPQITSLTNSVNALQSALNASLAALQKSRDSLTVALTQTNANLTSTNVNVANLGLRMDSVKTALVGINSQLNYLSLRIDSANSKIVSLNAQMATANSNIASINAQIVIINTNIANFTISINTLNQQYASLLITLNGILAQLNVTPTTLSNGLELWYPFSGNFLDSTSNHNGTNNGTSFTTDHNSQANSAISIANQTFVEVSNPLFSNNASQNQFAFSIWLKTGSSTSTLQTIFDKDSYWKRVHVDITATGSLMLSGSISSSYWRYETVDNIVQPNKWYNIIINYTAGATSFYVNGTAANQKSNAPSNVIDFSTQIAGNSDGKIYIGRDHPISGPINPFVGSIDDFRLYNRVLTQSEISYLSSH